MTPDSIHDVANRATATYESKATTSGGMATLSERMLEAGQVLAEMRRRDAHVRHYPHRPLRGRYEIWVDGERRDLATTADDAEKRLRAALGITAEQAAMVDERLRGAL